MGLFTRLDDSELRAIADAFALGPLVRAEGIEAGTVNSNYRLETADGRWFLRVNEGKAESDVVYEAELVAHIAARGVRTPAVRAATDGRPWARIGGHLCTLFPWLEAERLCARGVTAADARAAGEALARLHLAARDFPTRRESRYAFERIVERWRGLPAPPPGSELAAAIDETGRELQRLVLPEPRAARAALPRGVIHGDLFIDNVLRDAGGRLWLLDFEQASDGALAYDLAVAVCAWGYGDGFVAERVAALVAGYQAVRPLEPAERAGLYTEARAAATRFCVTRITDVELDPRATPTVKATKDYRRYLARLRALEAMGEAGFAALSGL